MRTSIIAWSLGLLLIGNCSVCAQQTNLEELEKRVKAQQEAERDGAGAKRKAEASRRAAPKATWFRFLRLPDGVLDDAQNIVSAASDNGGDIDWNNAIKYCTNKGGDWGLPTIWQAQKMFDASGQYQQMQSNQAGNWAIKPATALIQFSAGTGALWTSERDGSSSAFYVSLIDGGRGSLAASQPRSGLRALCVRRRS